MCVLIKQFFVQRNSLSHYILHYFWFYFWTIFGFTIYKKKLFELKIM